MIFENQQKLILVVRERRLLPWAQIASEIGISRETLTRIMEFTGPYRFQTLRKISYWLELNRKTWVNTEEGRNSGFADSLQ